MRLPSVLAVYKCTVICDQNARLTFQVYEELLSKKWLTDAASLSPNPWGPIKYQVLGWYSGSRYRLASKGRDPHRQSFNKVYRWLFLSAVGKPFPFVSARYLHER